MVFCNDKILAGHRWKHWDEKPNVIVKNHGYLLEQIVFIVCVSIFSFVKVAKAVIGIAPNRNYPTLPYILKKCECNRDLETSDVDF